METSERSVVCRRPIQNKTLKAFAEFDSQENDSGKTVLGKKRDFRAFPLHGFLPQRQTERKDSC